MSLVVPPPVQQQEGAARRARRGRRPAGMWAYGVLGAVLLFSAFPVYWSLLTSSQSQAEIAQTPPDLLPGRHLLDNMQRVFAQANFGQAMVNSLIVASLITVSVVFFSVMAGFAFAKLRFRGRHVLMVLVTLTMMIPPQLGVVPLYILMARIGWAGHLQAVIVPAMVSAFGVFFMRQYIAGAVPDELVEAARMDGCSMARTLWHVAFPASQPAAVVLALFTFVQAWNDFFWPLIVLTPASATVQVALSSLSSGYYQDFSLVMTGTALATLPVLLLFAVLGKHLFRRFDPSYGPG
ncbi:carbohydrate ABC transporter permease [Streptomyces lydicus]|uniref:carbohydrate ABC transporter permease n=1 Tax=Streptomyces lydicus TaxID=47763 RepID=UPI0036EB21B2